jgi:hypothetical protein
MSPYRDGVPVGHTPRDFESVGKPWLVPTPSIKWEAYDCQPVSEKAKIDEVSPELVTGTAATFSQRGQMRLITAPIASLTWQDMLDFCALNLPEGATVDYKRDIPSELERTVAAMANTSGGLILVGIDEERTSTKPVLPPFGLPTARGVPERITNLCISNITPPLVPEIALLRDSAGTSSVAVLRVPQSHQAPHAIARNTKVYLRRGSINSPENLATLDELEWLKAGRQKSSHFREELYQRAQARFVQFLRGYDGSNTKPARIERHGMLSLAFCPTYPKDMLLEPPALSAALREIRVRDYYRTDDEFPLGSLNGVVVQDGLIVHASVGGGDWAHHTEMNAFGLLFFKQSLLRTIPVNNRDSRVIRASEIFCRLDEMFDSARNFFAKLQFNGWLLFRMRLEKLVGYPFGKYSPDESGLSLSYTPDSSIDFDATIISSRLEEEKASVILAAARRVAWAFDWDVDRQLLNNYYSRYKGTNVV